jgi:Homeodomain-like domain
MFVSEARVQRFRRVQELAGTGLSDYKIAARTGVNRSTVQRWRYRELPPLARVLEGWELPDSVAYSYLLGCYLGDGWVSFKPPSSFTLRVACDQRYPVIIAEVRAAMETTFPGRQATQFPSSTGASDVVGICHPGIGQAFPQHGSGRKHKRKIVLADWQREITGRHPEALIRGLIHSDGCRVENRFRTELPSGRVAEYSYVRYFFSNLSADIRRIFAEHCELIGIRVTQSNHRNLSISHRKSVEVLETIVGPKR